MVDEALDSRASGVLDSEVSNAHITMER